MAGRAVFRPVDAAHLAYREDGVIDCAGGRRSTFFRDYIFRVAGDGVSILFADRRLFHELDFQGEHAATGRHLCGRDLYVVRYEFHNGPGGRAFNTRWHVKGPRKEYEIHTAYRAIST